MSQESRPASVPHHTQGSVLLDLMRGLAAVVVLVSHWKDILFVPWSESAQRSLPAKLFYAVTGGGHQAVIVFFVLSGYLIASSIVRARATNRWSWAVYLEHRLARLWTVLVPALLLVTLVDTIGRHLSRSAPLYFGTHSSNMLQDAAANLTPQVFLGNLMFLQDILTKTYGSDGPLWSLSYEFWYYILFPLALAALLRQMTFGMRIVNAVFFLLVASMVGHDIMVLFPVWLMGAALNYLPAAKPRPILTLCLGLAYAPLLFARSTGHPLLFEYLLGFATMGMIWLMLGMKGRAPDTLWVKASRELARFSYTLYLVHVPLLVLAAGLWIGLNLRQATPRFVLEALPLLGLALAVSYGFAWCTEFRTESVRRWMSGVRQRLLRPE